MRPPLSPTFRPATFPDATFPATVQPTTIQPLQESAAACNGTVFTVACHEDLMVELQGKK